MSGLDLQLPTCQELISKYPKYAEIFQILFENTQYFTREEILRDLEREINLWLQNRENLPLYIILPSHKIGSEYYFYYHFRNLLPEHTIIRDVYPEITEKSEFLFLDDWSLTGTNILNWLDKTFITDPDEEIPRYPGINHKLTIIVSIITEWAMERFNDPDEIGYFSFEPEITIYYTHIVPKFLDLLQSSGINRKLSLEFFKVFNDSLATAYPVHLDYKIANVHGSFPTIYGPCRNPPDRQFMDEIKKHF